MADDQACKYLIPGLDRGLQLLLAFGEGVQQVLPRHVRSAAADTPVAGPSRWQRFALAAALAAIVVVAAAFYTGTLE